MPASMRAFAPFWRGTGSKASSWAQEELARAMAHGITDGTRPGGYATREEAALMAERVYSGRA